MPVYHFTDTAHLPWIIDSGELRPGEAEVGALPADFLWATTNDRGCRSAAVHPSVYRDGVLQIIRFTLAATDFAGWQESASRSGWTAIQVASLETSATRLSDDPKEWRVRDAPLPLSKVIAVDAKSYSGRWTPIEATAEYCVAFKHDHRRRGFVIGEYAYYALQETRDGRTSYRDLFRTVVSRA